MRTITKVGIALGAVVGILIFADPESPSSEPSGTPAQAAPISGETADAVADEDLRSATDALELHYINKEIYQPVVCRSAEGPTRAWVRCSGAGADAPIGGLFFVMPDEAGKPRIWTGNGRAIQHLGDETRLSDIDGQVIQAGRWKGELVDLDEGFEAFGVSR